MLTVSGARPNKAPKTCLIIVVNILNIERTPRTVALSPSIDLSDKTNFDVKLSNA